MVLEEFGSHTGALEVLSILLKKKNNYRAELTHILNIDKDTCARTLFFLRDINLIEDEPAPEDDDQRKRIIRLTVKGEKVAKALAEAEKALSGH